MSSRVGTRYRLVTTMNGVEYVSSVVLSVAEVAEHMELEAGLHRWAGWTVGKIGHRLVCGREEKERTIEARPFSPMEDG